MHEKRSQFENKSPKSISERIEAFLDAKGMRPADLSRLSGISGGALSQILNGKRPNPGLDYLERIVSKTDISAHFLVTGEGEPVRMQPQPGHALTSDAILELFDRAEEVLGPRGLKGKKRQKLISLMMLELADGKSVNEVIRWALGVLAAEEGMRAA